MAGTVLGPVPEDDPVPGGVLQQEDIPDSAQPPDGDQDRQIFGQKGVFELVFGGLHRRCQTGLGQPGEGGLLLRSQGAAGGPVPPDAAVALARVEAQHGRLQQAEPAVLPLDVFQRLGGAQVQALADAARVQVDPPAPLDILPLGLVVGDVKGQLDQPGVRLDGADGLQVLQPPHPAQGLEEDGVLGGVVFPGQLVLQKIPGLLDGGAEKDQLAQGLAVSGVRLGGVRLDAAHRQGDAGEGGLQAGEVGAAEVLGQLVVGLGGAARQSAHSGGEQVGGHPLGHVQPLQLAGQLFLLGGGIGPLGFGGLRSLFLRPGRLPGPFVRNVLGELRHLKGLFGQLLE